MAQKVTQITAQELDELTYRVTEALEHGLSLSPEDLQLLVKALYTLAFLQDKLQSNDVTLHKLRKVIGMVKESEKMRALADELSPEQDKKRAPKPKKARPARPKITTKAEVIHHKLDGLKAGDPCPACPKGKLYRCEPASFLRIVGQSPFVAQQHVMERLRCNACGQYFTADLPDEVLNDGIPEQKYGYSARTVMTLSKFFAGTPFYRQERMQAVMGVHISASTVFDQTALVADCLKPIYVYLKQCAANAIHYYLDDTTNRILDEKPKEKKRRNSDKTQMRSGVYTSAMVAILQEGQKLILYQTNIGHAGEFIDELLHMRVSSLAPPILMSDALSSNRPSLQFSVVHCLCNSHSRRQFYDLYDFYPDKLGQVLMWYGQIWENDDKAKEQNLTPAQRLAWHQTHSLPVMEQIRDWGLAELETGETEENSSLGKAIKYFIKHYKGLTGFCLVEGAAIDNNTCERAIKLVARNRKNALFYKTQTGADVGDIIMSMVATAAEAGVNLFEYFNTVQRKRVEVAAHPERYTPWNYQANL